MPFISFLHHFTAFVYSKGRFWYNKQLQEWTLDAVHLPKMNHFFLKWRLCTVFCFYWLVLEKGRGWVIMQNHNYAHIEHCHKNIILHVCACWKKEQLSFYLVSMEIQVIFFFISFQLFSANRLLIGNWIPYFVIIYRIQRSGELEEG